MDQTGEGLEALVEEAYREFQEKVLPRITGLCDETRRALTLLAWLNRWLEEKGLGRLVVTGGFAVEVYTGRSYRTIDIDVVVQGSEQARLFVKELLSRIAEELPKGGRHVLREAGLLARCIDVIPGVEGAGAPPVKLVVEEGLYVYLEAPEDLILSYLYDWKRMGFTDSRDKALWLYAALRDLLDHQYLEDRAREKKLLEALEEVKALAERALESTLPGS